MSEDRKYDRVAYYPGCALEGTGHAYNRSTKAVGKALGLKLDEVKNWNCCGAMEVKNIDPKIQTYLSSRVMSIAANEMGHDGHCRHPCSTSEGFAFHTAFISANHYPVAVDLGKVGIGSAGRKFLVVTQFRTFRHDIDLLHVWDKPYHVRNPGVGVVQEGGSGEEVQGEIEPQIRGRGHFHAVLPVLFPGCQVPRIGAEAQAQGISHIMGQSKSGKATGRIPTHLCPGTISVEINHLGVQFLRGGFFQENQAIRPNSESSVTKVGDLFRGQMNGPVQIFYHYEVVSGSVHLCEIQPHLVAP